MRFGRSWLAAAALIAVALVFAACGDDDEGSANGGAAGGDAGGVSQETIDIGLEHTAGTEGEADPSLEPLRVGFVVQQGGAPSFPEMEAAADAAAEFINNNLGGVDGHPLELVKCSIQAEEDGQRCGSQLLRADVPIGMFSIAVVGNASLYDTIDARIPLIDSVTTLPIDTTTENVYNFAGGAPAILYARAADAAELAGGGTAALVSVDNPGGKYSTEAITVPTLDNLDVEHSRPVYFPDDATTPDLVSALQAAGGTDADVVVLDPSGPQNCVALYDAMSQLGVSTPVVATSICSAPSFVGDTAGGAPEGWRLWNFVLSSYLESHPEVQAYNEIMEAAGQSESADVGFAATMLRDMFLLARFANNLGADGWTPDGFSDEILAYRGEPFLAPGQEMNCADPIFPEQPGLCGRHAVGAAFVDGEWESIEPILVDTDAIEG